MSTILRCTRRPGRPATGQTTQVMRVPLALVPAVGELVKLWKKTARTAGYTAYHADPDLVPDAAYDCPACHGSRNPDEIDHAQDCPERDK